MRQTVIRALKPLDAVSIENGVGAGTPDVNFIHGWIELKSIPRWPSRQRTIVPIPHFHRGQRMWLAQRWNAGGGAWLLLKVGREWLLFNAPEAVKWIGNGTQNDLIGSCCWWNHNGLCEDTFLEYMRAGRRPFLCGADAPVATPRPVTA